MNNSDTKICPYCDFEMDNNARICPVCGRLVGKRRKNGVAAKFYNVRSLLLIIITGMFILAIILEIMGK
jgi:hypothetical protein